MNGLVAALAGLTGLMACAAASGGGPPSPPLRTDAPVHAMPTDPVAHIAVERPSEDSGRLRLTAEYEGPAADALHYRLTVLRVGTAGRSESAQSGAFSVTGDARQSLSTVQVSAGPGDRIEATLTITDGAEVIAQDRFEESVSERR